jgi:5-keto 4-deoxyuronate isomerase
MNFFKKARERFAKKKTRTKVTYTHKQRCFVACGRVATKEKKMETKSQNKQVLFPFFSDRFEITNIPGEKEIHIYAGI